MPGKIMPDMIASLYFISGEMFNRLLLFLAILDNVYLLIGIIEVYFHGLEAPSMRELYVYFWFLYPARSITLCSIIYLTILLAAQRYMSVAKPLSMRNPNMSGASWLKVIRFVGFVIFVSAFFKLPEFFETNVVNTILDNNTTNTSYDGAVLARDITDNGVHNISTELVISTLRRNHVYVLLYMNIANIVVTGIIPLVALTYFNYHIHQGMHRFVQRKSTRRRSVDVNRTKQIEKENQNQRNQTIILFAIVCMFVACHILRVVLNVQDMVIHNTTFADLDKNCTYGHPYWAMISHPISEILLKLNSSVNFFIYVAFNTSFRKAIRNHLFNILKLCGIEKSTDTIPVANTMQSCDTRLTTAIRSRCPSPLLPMYEKNEEIPLVDILHNK
jgi:hypothetical protein